MKGWGALEMRGGAGILPATRPQYLGGVGILPAERLRFFASFE